MQTSVRVSRWLIVAICAGALGMFAVAQESTAPAAPTFIYLVRHAEKLETPPQDPALSAAGKKRAQELQAILRGVKLNAVYHTEARRTHDTVIPTAGLHKIAPKMIGAPEIDRLVDTLKIKHSGEIVLVAGHSNTLPKILRGLGVAEAEVPEIREHEYDHLFLVMLNIGDKTLMHHLHYGDRNSR